MLRNLVFWYNEAYGPINDVEDKKNKRKNFSAPYIKPMVTFKNQQGTVEKMSRYGSRILRKRLWQQSTRDQDQATIEGRAEEQLRTALRFEYYQKASICWNGK